MPRLWNNITDEMLYDYYQRQAQILINKETKWRKPVRKKKNLLKLDFNKHHLTIGNNSNIGIATTIVNNRPIIAGSRFNINDWYTHFAYLTEE